MATSSEDALGELYAWDSTIDEMYERGVDHADFDEDEALEAYEEMIQVGAAPPEEAHGDAVLSLAAQLLTKHFYKFPHVHMNVVDVLLGLCAPAHAQAVRIHTVRSLLQIVKAAPTATPPLVAACRGRIADGVAALIQDEASAVLVRHLTQLQDTLAAVDADLTKAEKREMWKEKKELAKAQRNAAREDEKARRSASSKQAEDDEDRRNRSVMSSRSSKHSDRDQRRREEIQREEAAKRERREARFGTVTAETLDRDTADDSKLRDARAPEPSSGYDQKYRDSHREERGNDDRAPPRQERYPEPSRDEPARERRPSGTKETGNGCPPSSFIFIGGVPRNTYPEDIINYLSCIDESVTYSCVQIKFPNAHPHAAGYAFVSLESVEHARKAIRHIQTTEFNGRNLIGDFARGPPCSTLQFVERNGSLGMHDLDAVLPVNGDTIDPSVWDDLCAFLKQYGSLDILRDGRIRFRDTESAKLVIRKHRIFIQGHEFLPVYDPEEQSEIDSSRRRRRSNDDGNHRRDEGASRYGTTDKTDRRDSRDDEDRKRRRSQSFDHDQKEKFPRHDHNDEKGDRHQHHAPREFDQARYGPRDSPSSSFKRRDETARSKDGSNRRERSASRERDVKTDHRSRDVQRISTRDDLFRGRSPVRSTTTEKRSSHHGRSRSLSQAKRFSENQSSPKAPSHRGRSPAASTSGAKYGRGDNGDHGRERRDSSIAPRDEDRGGREWKSKDFDGPDRRHSHDKYADRTNRSRSPTKRHEYSDDRRKQESTRRDHDERVSQAHRGRSHSPRRAPQAEPSDNGGYGRSTYKRDEPRQDDHRSRPFNRDDKSAFHKYGADYGSKDKTSHVSAREESQPSRFGGGERERSDRRVSSSQPMSKYGTVGGAERSPSPPHFGREESGNGRELNDRFSRGDEKNAQHGKSRNDHGFHRYGNENQSRENRDRPFRHDFNNHGKYHNENQQRGRSPPSKRTNDREEFNGGRHRSRSPSPVGSSGKRKHRSRSPHPTEEGGGYRGHRDHHDSRFNGGDRRRRDEQDRHFKRNNGGGYRSRYDDKYKADRTRDDRRTHERESATVSSPRKSTKRDDERPPRSSSAHAPRDQRTRTPSPMTFDTNMNDEGPATESPRAPLMEKVSSAYEDIDECMVDYEEDE